MIRAATFLSILVTLFAAAAMVGCSASTRSVFRPTDPTFTPRPGPTPPVYLQQNIGDVPKEPMRSVGLIEVTVPGSSGIKRAIEVATAKGRELGCWILIEHSAFATVQSSASLDHGATIVLAHGSGPHIGGPVAPEGKVTARFDCVVAAREARARTRPRSGSGRARPFVVATPGSNTGAP